MLHNRWPCLLTMIDLHAIFYFKFVLQNFTWRPTSIYCFYILFTMTCYFITAQHRALWNTAFGLMMNGFTTTTKQILTSPSHPKLYPMDARCSFCRRKVARETSWPLLLSSVKVKTAWSFTCTHFIYHHERYKLIKCSAWIENGAERRGRG
jgi:hypothetical protein